MTDAVFDAPPSVRAATRWEAIKAAIGVGKPSEGQVKKPSEDGASFHMLGLYRTNLGVRLRTIDETSLVTDNQKKIYAAVTETLNAPAHDLDWDHIYTAESLIGLLYGGDELRQEIGARLQELAN